MSLWRKAFRFFSLHLWGGLPSPLQRWISRFYARMYDKPFSRHIIGPYCKVNYDNPAYLEKFVPASGSDTYQSFQDFFTRRLKDPLSIAHGPAWGCEGLLCEHGRVHEKPLIQVKGQRRHLKDIFGTTEVPEYHYFSNIFLHNNNYHRIHAPVCGRVTRIEHVPGDLVILRPWIYDNDPSIPALRNERVNVDIMSDKGKWFLSIVGGPAVGTIVLNAAVALDQYVSVGDELAVFLLGSTCCIASPIPLSHAKVGEHVEVGQPF